MVRRAGLEKSRVEVEGSRVRYILWSFDEAPPAIFCVRS